MGTPTVFTADLGTFPGCTILPSLPQEVYGNISQFLGDRRELLSLCFVSRAFCHEAERILYDSVDLAYDQSRIQRWFKMIASIEEPRFQNRAASVHSLTFGITYSRPAPTWLKNIEQGLRSLTNLKELNLESDTQGPCDFLSKYYASFVFPGHCSPYPFRLQKFRNTMFNLEPTLSFLTTQPNITVFHQLTPTPCELEYNNLLPCLSRASLSPWLIPKLGSRPLTHIYTATTPEMGNLDMEQSLVDTLAPYNGTLTSLTLERYAVDESMKLGDFVACLAESLPLLEELSLWHRGELEVDSSTHETISSFVHFTRLKHLSLLPPRGKNSDSLYMDMLKRETSIALLFFQSLSGLRRLAFPLRPPCEPMCTRPPPPSHPHSPQSQLQTNPHPHLSTPFPPPLQLHCLARSFFHLFLERL